MSRRRALVTGGAGVVGSAIVDELVRDGGWEIGVFDQFSRGRPEHLAWAVANGPVTVIEGDIRDRAAVSAAVEGVDVVFHQAAIRITQCAEQPRLAMEVMVDGTFNVVDAASCAGVSKIVAASSAAVYGMAEKFPTPESHHLYNNRTLYGTAKASNESLLRTYHDMCGLNYVALRYFNVYGPRMAVHGPYTEVLIRWMERIGDGFPPLILGDGRQTMDFVHADDVARANILAAESLVTDDVLNVGTGVETSLLELANALLRVMNSDLQPEFGPERAVNPVPRRLADTRLAAELIGFKAQIELEAGLTSLVDWWTSQRQVLAS